MITFQQISNIVIVMCSGFNPLLLEAGAFVALMCCITIIKKVLKV